jgi:hypothetical protein
MRAKMFSILFAASLSVYAGAQTDATSKFELVGTYKALGGLMATTVAPGPFEGSERLYGSYLYADNTLDVIAVNPADGKSEVFHNVVPGEYGARNIAVGPNGDVFLGSLPHAHFLQIDRKAHRMIDLGRPSANEEYIWDVAFGKDQRLYGVTYPGCRLVRYDPATHKMEDLGKMDATEKYGRWIVGGRDRFMYIGIGTAKANIAVFDTKTGELREVLPKELQTIGTPKPYIGVDGKAYATLDKHLFALNGFSLREIPVNQQVEPANADVLKNGDVLDLGEGDGMLTVKHPHAGTERKLKISYEGEDLQIFRVGFGPDGKLYGSSILPIHFLHVDVTSRKIKQLGDLGGGEIYSFLPHDGKLLMGAYSGLSPLMSYTPDMSLSPSEKGNPLLVDYSGSDHAWRPQAMIAGPDGNVYVGATAGYGKLEGPLLLWTGKPDSVKLFNGLVQGQSIVSLASWKDSIVGGTTTQGGGGSHPIAGDAHIFTWDTLSHRKGADLVPVEGAKTITDLVVAKKGIVYGIAVSGTEHTLFAFDPETRKIVSQRPTPFRNVIYNSIGLLPNGMIVGLAEEGIFTIDESTGNTRILAKTPMKITGGFALRDNTVYFVSNSDVYRYHLGVDNAH